MNLTVELNEYHRHFMEMLINEQQEQDAKILQTFLQTLKRISTKMERADLDPVSDAIYEDLLNKMAGRHHSSFKLKNLFTTTGGKSLETALTDIVAAMYELHDLAPDDAEINTGEQRGTSAEVVYQELNGMVNKVAETLVGKTTQFLGKEFKKFNQLGEGKFFARVPRKTDVKGLNLLEIDAGADMLDVERAMAILDRANISAKNYSSKGWGAMQDLSGKPLRFGKTNIQRAVKSTLSLVISNPDDINATFYSMINNITDANVQRHLYHMRFIYELTGLGMEIVNRDTMKFTGERESAEFVVYNDPASDTAIYVKSASELIRNYMMQQETTLMSAFDVIEVDKSFFSDGD